MKKKFEATVGVFAGILNENGELLVRRRVLEGEEKSLIISEKVYGDYELPGGIAEQKEMLAIGNEKGLIAVAKRETKEELGLEINPPLTSLMIPIIFTKEFADKKIVNDIAFVIPIQPDQWTGEPEGEVVWVAPDELRELAEKPKGEQLLSGWGKRMCRMSLHALCYSPNSVIRKKATDMLLLIQKEL